MKFQEILPVGILQTGGQTDMTKLKASFHYLCDHALRTARKHSILVITHKTYAANLV